MPKLYHPGLDRYHDVPGDQAAAVYRRSGWVDADDADEARFFLASAGVDAREAAETHVGGDTPEPTPNIEEE